MTTVHKILVSLLVICCMGIVAAQQMRINIMQGLLTTAEEAHTSAMEDCKRIVAVETYFSRTAACYQTVVQMCRGDERCIGAYQQMCPYLTYEQ